MPPNKDVVAVQMSDSSSGTFTTTGSSPLVQKNLNMSVNKWFLFIFMTTFNMPGLVLGYAMAYANPLTTCFNLKFGWDTDAEKAHYNSLIGSSLVLGMTIGAVCGGILMRIGRRRAVIIVNTLGIIGCALTITPLDYVRILIGRFLLGLSVGLISSICPKMLEETIPNHLFD